MGIISAFIPLITAIVVIALVVIIFKSCYKKAPPNKASADSAC